MLEPQLRTNVLHEAQHFDMSMQVYGEVTLPIQCVEASSKADSMWNYSIVSNDKRVSTGSLSKLDCHIPCDKVSRVELFPFATRICIG